MDDGMDLNELDKLPDFNAEEGVTFIKMNTTRLEQYLQSIQKRLKQHDTAIKEQIEHADRLSKADDAKIARLAVKLDHCMMDVNNFKDSYIAERGNDSSTASGASSAAVAKLQAQLEALSTLVRRTELSQAEGLDSFSQIKQLTTTLKLVTRQLDSLGRNSVILELRQYVERLAESLRAEYAKGQAAAAEEASGLRSWLQRLQEEDIQALTQRLAVIEEKSVLYDLVLSEQGPEGDTGEDLAVEEGAGETGEGGAPALEEGEAVSKVDLGPDGEPLRPSQMLLLEQGSGPSSPGSPVQASAPSHDGSYLSVREAADTAGELWTASRSSAAALIDGNPTGGASQRLHRSAIASSSGSAQPFRASWLAGSSATLTGGSAGQAGDAAGASTSALVSKKGSIRASNGNFTRASFFTNLMGQYVGRNEFAEAVQEVASFARKAVSRLKEQVQGHAASLLFRCLVRILQSITLWRRDRAFRLLRDNVANWHAVRNRRNRAKALLFQSRMEQICKKHVCTFGFRYWARMTWMFRERERLRLWLRNVLQHWINMRVINVRVYLNRWKRCTVFSYHSSLFAGDQGELEATGISDDFRRLLESDNFSLREVKRIAKEDMRRRWGLRDRQERLLKQQELAIREQVQKITAAVTGGDLSIFGGASMKPEEVQAMRAKIAEVEETLQQIRQEQRRMFNNMESASTETDAKIEAEGHKIAAEFNIYRSQVAVRFNDCKEGLANLQADVKSQFEAEHRRVTHLEDRLKLIDRRLDGEQSKIAPLQAEQQRMQSMLDALKSELRVTDTQVDALSGQIERATAASLSTVESNHRLEKVLSENAEYYDVELRFMRAHVAETVSSLAEMKEEKLAFVNKVDSTIQGMLQDLNSFVERLPSGAELFAICRDYEDMWVRLHYEGPGSSPQLAALPDQLHARVAEAALRIAHHMASAADRLVLSRWTAAGTAKKAIPNPQEAPAARGRTVTSATAATSHSAGRQQQDHATSTHLLSEVRPETDGDAGTRTAAATLGVGKQVEAAWGTPSTDLVEQVREELLQTYLADGLGALLKAADAKEGPPGLLKSTGRATFQRKLRKSIEAALTKHPVMEDPAQTSSAAALSLGRMSRKQQLQRLAAQSDTCVSCGHELGRAQTAPFIHPIAVATTRTNLSATDRRTYQYPPLAQTTQEPAEEDDPHTHTSFTAIEENRPDSPLSQISVTVRRSPTSFARPPPEFPRDEQKHEVATIVLAQPPVPSATANYSTNSRPLSASASASTRHREAVRHSQQAATAATASDTQDKTPPNMRSAGRETSLFVRQQVQHTSSPPQLQQPHSARIAAGFEVPRAAGQQASTHLAGQLASRFRQDASIQGVDVRKMDASDVLGPLQMSRKLYGTHSSNTGAER